jgi:hypothetical protein
MKKILWILLVGLLFTVCGDTVARAGEIELLVNKLVEKGVITPLEAQIILDETKTQVSKELAEGKAYSAPAWTQKISMKGDLRTRYQIDDLEGDEERHRFRIRFRLGAEAKVTDNFKVNAGFATGGSDARSTNQTLENSFETGDLRLDYAYATWDPYEWLTVKSGKIKAMNAGSGSSPFAKGVVWSPADLLWDTDINSDGASAQFHWAAYPNFDFFVNTGAFIMDENNNDHLEPYMWLAQPGFVWDINPEYLPQRIQAIATFNYYGFDNVKGHVGRLDNNAGTNTLNNGRLMYDYDSIGASGQLAFTHPFGEEPVFTILKLPYAALFADYINNPDASTEDDGWLIGGKIGHKKVSKPKTWQLKYQYRRLEQDAWLDCFPDSDAYGGATNVKGHEVVFNYAFFKNVILGLDYYHMEPIIGANRPKEDIFQADMVYKF